MQYIPMLKIIYESVEGKTNYSQVYILLTIMLILSQDDVNNETIQKIVSNAMATQALIDLSMYV